MKRSKATPALRGARRAGLERDRADPGGLAVVVRSASAPCGPACVGEHAALGDDREVEALGDAGVDLDAARATFFSAATGCAEAAVQALRLAPPAPPVHTCCSGATMLP